MTDPQRIATPAAHARHDTSIVAALAARDVDSSDAEAQAARDQVASCDACADVLADIVTLQTALPESATPRRPRDFRLTPDDAHRLRRSGWRRFLGQIGSPRDGFSRPLAIGLTTLGLAGVLLASLSTVIGGAGGAAPQRLSPVGSAIQAAPAPAAGGADSSTERTSLEAAGAAPSPAASAAGGSSDGQVFTGGNPDEVVPDITGEIDTAIRDDATGFSVLFVVGGILLIAGLGIFMLRWSARRLS
jgi:hypothetical protein